jgi:hypothetical protein
MDIQGITSNNKFIVVMERDELAKLIGKSSHNLPKNEYILGKSYGIYGAWSSISKFQEALNARKTAIKGLNGVIELLNEIQLPSIEVN